PHPGHDEAAVPVGRHRVLELEAAAWLADLELGAQTAAGRIEELGLDDGGRRAHDLEPDDEERVVRGTYRDHRRKRAPHRVHLEVRSQRRPGAVEALAE